MASERPRKSCGWALLGQVIAIFEVYRSESGLTEPNDLDEHRKSRSIHY